MATPVTNFAKVTVSTTYGSGNTSIVLTAGHGSRLPSTFPYPLTWWNVTDYPDPADDPNREIVTVTARTTDTLTVTRGAENIAATTKNAGGKTYKMLLGITAAMYTGIFDLSLSQEFRGLSLQTHPDNTLALSNVYLAHADAITMNNGEELADWNGLTASLAASGIGGIDTGSEQASTWYEIYAAYNGSAKGLFLHRAKNYFLDESNVTDDQTTWLRKATTNLRISQGFQTDVAGKIEFVDVKLIKENAPTGNFWFTIQANNGGVPSDTPLATSDKLDATRLTVGTATWIRIPFRTPYSVSASTTYHLVMHGDYTLHDTINVGWRSKGTASSYAKGALSHSTSATSGGWTAVANDDMVFKIYVTENDVAVSGTYPTGYSQYARIGWCYNNASSNLKYFTQIDRTVMCGTETQWLMFTTSVTTPTLLDLAAFVPPVTVNAQLTVYSGAAASLSFGDLQCTDVSVGAPASRPGEQQHTVGGTNWLNPSASINIGPYQGMMVVVASSTHTFYLMKFTW
jgi:hypothetical protein